MSEELCLVNALNQIYLCCFCINLIKYNDILAQPASDEVTLKFYVQSQSVSLCISILTVTVINTVV